MAETFARRLPSSPSTPAADPISGPPPRALGFAPPLVRHVIHSPGRPLDDAVRAEFEPRFDHDFSGVRIHTDAEATASARAIHAHAYAAGHHLVFASGAYAPRTTDGHRRLAHELVHVLQQSRASTAIVQRDLTSPDRFSTVHHALFNAAPGTGGSRRAWRDASGTDAGTAGEILDQARASIRQHVRDRPMSVGGSVPTRSTEADVDADALVIDQRIRAHFPQITTVPTPTQITDAAGVMTSALTGSDDYLHQWLANRLIDWTDLELYEIGESDPRLVAVFDALLAEREIGGWIRTLASRVGGFQRGEGARREIFINRGVDAGARQVVLIHELVHFHGHPLFREWVDGTTDPRFYNEGFTEWLAQQVMTADERASRSSYTDRVAAIQREVAAHVPPDDIARAYFAGEVWRLENRSTVARREFASQAALPATGTPATEAAASRAGPGLNQEVVTGRHYRFLNLGHDQPQPKPEHVTYFNALKSRFLDPAPTTTVRFEGHASSPGPTDYNLRLSRRRTLAFYQMARDAGLPEARLANPRAPVFFGEGRLTLTEEDPQTRAFNRRVELFLETPVAAPATDAPTETRRETESSATR